MISFMEYLLESKTVTSDSAQRVLTSFDAAKEYFDTIGSLDGTGITLDDVEEMYDIMDKSGSKAPIVANYKNTKGKFVLRRWVKNAVDSSKFIEKTNFAGYHDTSMKDSQSDAASAGQSAGEHAESAVAFIFNNIGNATTISAKLRSELVKNGLTDDWIQSSLFTALKINNVGFKSSEYIAAHVNGDDFETLPESARMIAAIFFGKSKFKEALKIDDKAVLKDLDKLYVGIKDNWNKADIVLVKNNGKYSPDKIYKKIVDAKITTCKMLNDILNKAIEEDLIVPISLKKIVPKKNLSLSDIKFEKEGNSTSIDKDSLSIAQIKSVNLVLPKKVDDQTNNGSCYLMTDNGLKMQFRRQTSTHSDADNLSIELILKAARGGKPLTKIKYDLGIVDNSYYITFKDKDDFVKNMPLYIRSNDMDVPSNTLIASSKNWFNKTCFKGLAGLLSAYYDKYPDCSLIDFFKYAHEKASGSDSESIFYLITMK